MYLRQRSSHGSRWIKPFYNLASLQRRAPNTYTWDFPDVIKLFVAAHKISEKAIRFRHPDYNPDGAQKLTSSSMCRLCCHATFHPNPCTRFWVILLIDRQTNEYRQKHLYPPLPEVTNKSTYLWNQVDLSAFIWVLIGKQHVVMWYGEPPDAPNQSQSRSLPKLNAIFRDSQAVQP